mmetsp:Transcript_13046/g.37171  ORF Transcript_13046/g.37171 Transcript_13046/m.37171 type:complete len:217 (-) Transcript_13046:1553-2203(-)
MTFRVRRGRERGEHGLDCIHIGTSPTRVALLAVLLLDLIEGLARILMRHVFEVLDRFVVDLRRRREAQGPQQGGAECGVDHDREHGDAANVEHEVGANLRRDAGFLVHNNGQDQAHSTSQAAPSHHEGFLPGDRFTEAVHQWPEDENHGGPDGGHGKVKQKEPAEVFVLQVALARDAPVAEEEPGEQEDDGVPQELDGLPNNVHRLTRGKARPSVV